MHSSDHSPDLLTGLNPEQQEAVRHFRGPLLVLAGPGSGKTRVITHRVAYLIQEHRVPAHNILAVTFTNKAADEMRRRLATLVPDQKPLACTFHSLGARLLRTYAHKIRRERNFSIIDQSDRQKLISQILKEQKHDLTHIPADGVERKISQLKGDLLSPDDFEAQAVDYHSRIVLDTYRSYEEKLEEMNGLDFDDLLVAVSRLLRTDADVREALNNRFEFVLVDEYQDTNLAQYAIARGLTAIHRNLCATGDPDQSIYGWRGANLENILQFEEDFPDAKVVRLEENYRSTGNILRCADELIKHNRRRAEKGLRTSNPLGPPVTVYCHRHDSAEAHGVAEAIRIGVDQGSRRYHDFAVFVRTGSLTRSVEAAFRARHIPYQIVGGFSFFERKEIKDLLAYARLLANPRDAAAFERAVGVPSRGIGETSLEKLRKAKSLSQDSLLDLARNPERAKIKGKPATALREFAQTLDELMESVTLPPDLAFEAILERIDYRKIFVGQTEEEEQERLGNVEDFIAGARAFRLEHPDANLETFLETVSLATDADRVDSSADTVQILTLHSAKGLEFPVVFMIAFEHDILPHERAMREGQEEEERRLAFVGITRAREELIISYTRQRTYLGRTMLRSPSSFLLELPADALRRDDVVVSVPSDDFDQDYSQETWDHEPSIPIFRGSSEPSASDKFRSGMIVHHPRYGDGKILQLEGVGDDRRATVQFPTAGVKRFILSMAPLVPVEEEDSLF